MRGEDAYINAAYQYVGETPPHAWGRQSSLVIAPPTLGNTPTCVGKTHRAAWRGRMSEKHPHMRGEDPCGSFRPLSGIETPPHAWGRPVSIRWSCRIEGNTPTCVGKTYGFSEATAPSEKHPHMRGEDILGHVHPEIGQETPPHAWGRP